MEKTKTKNSVIKYIRWIMKVSHLEVQDNVPDKVENNRRDAISNTRGIDVKKLNLGDNVTVSKCITIDSVVLN